MKYSFDTSGFLAPYRNLMPPDLVPSLWEKLDALVNAHEIVASKEVYLEISQKDDGLLDWVKERKEMFVEVDSEQIVYLEEIMYDYPDWVDIDAQKNIADPYVIALAREYNLTVVSFEKGGSEINPSIPFVCRKYNVSHLGFFDFLREVGFRA